MLDPVTIKAVFDVLFPLFKTNNEIDVQNKKRFFKSVIEPSFANFEVIHKDYLKNFRQLRDLFSQHEWPSEGIASWLREISSQYLSDRDKLKNFETNIENFEIYFRSKKLLPLRDLYLIQETFCQYCHNIVNYFDSGLWETTSSWYTDFLGLLESTINHFNEEFEHWKLEGIIPPDAQKDTILATLKNGNYHNKRFQKLFNTGFVFNPEIGLGISINAASCDRTLNELRTRFSKVQENHQKLSALCSYQ